MSIYTIVLFVHIVGALGFFLALGLEWTGLWQIRSAMTTEQVRPWMGIFKSVRKVGFGSMATTVVTGLYLMLAVWGSVAWIIVTLGAIVLMIALAQVVTAPRMAAIGRALATEKGALSGAFQALTKNPLLWVSIQTRVAIALGIVFLKVAKPGLGESLLTLGIAIILGIASALPVPSRERAVDM
jgi:hypothetical protein